MEVICENPRITFDGKRYHMQDAGVNIKALKVEGLFRQASVYRNLQKDHVADMQKRQK